MRILLAVSGGIDSMYLALRRADLFPDASEFAVAHCNFSLRGEESDGDEKFVRDFCAREGLRCFVRRFDTTAYAESGGISIEMAARELRYAWFAELCRQEGFDAVGIAHNSNDSVETMVLNLLRGTGAKGLRGISAESESGGCRILRPMLETTREQILAWMQAHQQSWREDSTNAELKYKRNIVRGEIFPLFAKINPSYLRTLKQDAERISEVDEIAEEYYRSADVVEDGKIIISRLLALKHWKYVLFRATEGLVSAAELRSLTSALESGESLAGKRFGRVWASSTTLIIRETPETAFSMEELDRSEIVELRQKEGTLILDLDALPQPLKIREWREGDYMNPLGMKGVGGKPGRKKISDLFVDLKISGPEKNLCRVLELDGPHVAALLPLRIDEAVKVTPSTKRVLRIRRK